MNTYLIEMSGVYGDEGFCPCGSVSLDFTSLEETVCYCSAESQAVLREGLEKVPSEGIHWIDSGDYHYLSLFMAEKIREPFVFYLIDNHPDDQEPDFPEILSCGGWIPYVRKLPFCKGTVGPLPLCGLDSISEDLMKYPAYISIDKDALSKDFARTDWSQGSMSFVELKETIKKISALHGRIIGTDICGELPLSKGAVADDLKVNLKTNEALQDLLNCSL